MTASQAAMSQWDARSEPRDDVHYRARAIAPDGRAVQLLVVNISASGLMVRCDLPCAVGDRLSITLPVVGAVEAEVRWSLGGRIGCQLTRPIGLADYYGLLAALVRR